MSQTIIGMFDNNTSAANARERLLASGISDSAIRLSASDSGTVASQQTTTTSTGNHEMSFWEGLKEMFGGSNDSHADNDLAYYREGARRGGVVVSVDAQESNVDEVADILESAGAVDIDEQAHEWRQSGWAQPTAERSTAAATSTATTADAASAGKIDLVKEELAVGKRAVNRGGVRIVKRVIERPVEQEVELNEERVSVDRRVVDRPLHGTEVEQAFKDDVIEATETGEEVVASKTARVVGEVAVGKAAEKRTEKVQDTLRETDVRVERLPGQGDSSSTAKSMDDSTAAEVSRTKTNV